MQGGDIHSQEKYDAEDEDRPGMQAGMSRRKWIIYGHGREVHFVKLTTANTSSRKSSNSPSVSWPCLAHYHNSNVLFLNFDVALAPTTRVHEYILYTGNSIHYVLFSTGIKLLIVTNYQRAPLLFSGAVMGATKSNGVAWQVADGNQY